MVARTLAVTEKGKVSNNVGNRRNQMATRRRRTELSVSSIVLVPASTTTDVTHKLKQAAVSEFKAKDIFRACGSLLLGISTALSAAMRSQPSVTTCGFESAVRSMGVSSVMVNSQVRQGFERKGSAAVVFHH